MKSSSQPVSVVAFFGLCILLPFMWTITRCHAQEKSQGQNAMDTGQPPIITQNESLEPNAACDRVRERALTVLKQRQPDEHDGETLFNAVWSLTSCRTRAAIPLLSKNITYEPPHYQPAPGAGPTYDQYLAAQALIAIGTPSTPEMLNLISDPKRSELELRLAGWVLLCIEAEASDESLEFAVEDDFVKEGVLRRIEHHSGFSGLPHSMRRQKNYEFVAEFIRSFGLTTGRWQENPEILGSYLLPLATADVTVRHQFQGKPPKNHPKALLKFHLDKDKNRDEDWGIHLSESGELTGAPKKPGMLKLAINVRAKHEGTPSESRGRRIFMLYVRDPNEPPPK